jgi:hypothetical protein
VTVSCSHNLTINVLHLKPEYRPQLDVSLPREDDPKFLEYYVSSETILAQGNLIVIRPIQAADGGDTAVVVTAALSRQ